MESKPAWRPAVHNPIRPSRFFSLLLLLALLPTACGPTPQTASPSSSASPTLPTPTEAVPFRLRIEYTLTSDWGTLEINGLEEALTMQVVERTGTATDVVGAGMIDLSRPLADLTDEPSVGLMVEVVLPPGEHAPLEFLSKHGAIGGSQIAVYYLPETGEPVLLGQFDHMWTDSGNPDTSATRFSVDLDPLHAPPTPTPSPTPFPTRLPAALTPEQSPVVEQLAWAIYYPWYLEEMYPRAWSSDIWTDRPLVPYESDDPQGIRQHIQWAQSAGLDGFLVEWCGVGRPGDNDVIDQNLGLILDIAYQMDFKIAAYFDILCLGDNSPANLRAQMEYLLEQRATHPGYYWMNGWPVVVMYSTDSASDEVWAALFDDLAAGGLQAIHVGDSYQPGHLEVFDGLHQYANFSYTYLGSIYADLEQAVETRRLSDPQASHFWAATVQVGFDNTPLYNARGTLSNMTEEDILIVDRLGGQTYRDSWDLALQADPDWIIVTSWNEWQENTHIEPSQMYNDQYLQLTAEYIERWKSP